MSDKPQSGLSFPEEERKLFVARVRMAAYYMCVPVVLSFSLVDYFFEREQWWSFFQARLLSIPACIACYHLYRTKFFEVKWPVFPAMIVSTYLGAYVAFMVSRSGYEHSAYYAGLNLIAIGSLSFIPWNWKNLGLAVLANYAPYFLVVLWGRVSQIDTSAFIPHLAFCFSTVFLGGVTNFLSRQLRMKEYEGRVQLMNEISTKNAVIEQKTKEGIYLEKLTNQFSPQIIDGVKTGRLSVDGMSRREVTCLFLDVESSTNRSVRLDRDDYTAILSEFFSLVTEILIRHDVTVGTYLGDGMLAFANAPQNQPGHRTIVMKAALEILKAHHARQSYYLEKWRAQFNVRLGINTGYVFVGFFPSFKRGTYTALGAPVNLASRLCAQAPSNSILVTKSVVKELASDLKEVNVKQHGMIDHIKGFEGEKFDLYSIIPHFESFEKEKDACPLCAGLIIVENDLGDSLYVKCSKCGYSDLRPKAVEELRKAA